MTKFRYGFISIIIFALIGCSTPQIVKNLSQEEVKAQIAAKKTLQNYFEVIEQMVQKQIRLNVISDQISYTKKVNLYKKKYTLSLKQPGVNSNELLDNLTSSIKKATITMLDSKTNYQQKYAKLKTKHAEILNMLDKMIEAQKTLNNYIQLEKVNDLVTIDILSSLGTNQETIDKYSNEISNIINDVSNIKGDE